MRTKGTFIASVAVITVALLLGGARAYANGRTINDQTVRNAVESELQFDQAVSLNDIDVTVEHGVVTLKGQVDDALARDRAARIARTVRGVRSVINRIEVRTLADRNAETIKRDVEAALHENPATESYEVNVRVKNDHEVMLSGVVDSWQERHLAERVAKGVRGVTAVHNDIDVTYPSARSDDEIRRDVKQALRWNVNIDDALIDVRVQDGVVHLSGTVGSAAERSKASLLAWVAGTKSVDYSGLEVAKWARDANLRTGMYDDQSDQDIREAIERALLYDPRVVASKVTPHVINGVVNLRGTVTNLASKRAAEQVARNTVGVVNVNNRIKVRPEGKLEDADIAELVRGALERSAVVNAGDITVNVENGIVYLTGLVDSYYDRYSADGVAAGVPGVKTVNNRLEVSAVDNPVIWNPYVDEWYINGERWYELPTTYDLTSDAEIKDDIEDELWWSPFVDEDQVHVQVVDGTAILSGVVDTAGERRAAVENAFEGGALWVKNRLTLK